MAHLTSHHTLPPFPNDVKTAPLVSISLTKLEAGDPAESSAFFRACKQLGFFYLEMTGSTLGESIVREAEQLNEVQKEFFKLPNKVKDVYGRPHVRLTAVNVLTIARSVLRLPLLRAARKG